MRILHIAYSINEQSAAYRLAEEQALQKGNQIYFLLARKLTSSFIQGRRVFPFLSSFFGTFSHLIDYIFNKCLVQSGEVFSLGINYPFKNKILKYLILNTQPEVIHIHWGGYSFITPILLRELSRIKNIKVVVTAHDYYYFTGGCHIPMNCPEFKNNCSNCPISKNIIGKRWISNNRKIVNGILCNSNITFIAPSAYSKNYVDSSISGVKCDLISNTAGNIYNIDKTELIKNFEKFKQYRLLNNNAPTILVVGVKSSLRQNKGNDIILELTNRFFLNSNQVNVITVGEFINLNLHGNHLHFNSRTNDEMQQLYFHVDLCVVPSRFETFSQVSLESILCATPVVAFDLTGPVDIIEDGISGFLVKSFDVYEFYTKVTANLNYKLMHGDLVVQSALNASDKFSPATVASQYQIIYQKLSRSISDYE
jgi:glycosyltransferase involved in cell wall biosynthesis